MNMVFVSDCAISLFSSVELLRDEPEGLLRMYVMAGTGLALKGYLILLRMFQKQLVHVNVECKQLITR